MYLRVLRQSARSSKQSFGVSRMPLPMHTGSLLSVFPSTPGLGPILTNSLGSPGTSPCCVFFLTSSTHYQSRVKCPRF